MIQSFNFTIFWGWQGCDLRGGGELCGGFSIHNLQKFNQSISSEFSTRSWGKYKVYHLQLYSLTQTITVYWIGGGRGGGVLFFRRYQDACGTCVEQYGSFVKVLRQKQEKLNCNEYINNNLNPASPQAGPDSRNWGG